MIQMRRRNQPWLRRWVIVACGTLCASAAVSCAPKVDTEAEARTLTQLDDAWSRTAGTRNADSVGAYYAIDAIAYPPGAPVAVGRAAATAVWASGFADTSYAISWRTDHATVAASGDVGFTAGTYEESYRKADGSRTTTHGKYVCIWRKQPDGSWKAFRDIWNVDTM